MAFKNIEGCIFDWAGTMVDFGSFAPTQVLVEVFAEMGLEVTIQQARSPMGKAKREHIKAICQMPEIAEQWNRKFTETVTETAIDEIYARFMPLQRDRVGVFSKPIPKAVDMLHQLRMQNVKIGSCTGYPRTIMETLLPLAAQEGIVPDFVVCADDLMAGARPGPWMALQNVIELGISDVRRCVKIDDTPVGILEGKNAGMWCVGLAVSGNLVGLSHEEWVTLSDEAQENLRAEATTALYAAGADIVVDSIADLMFALNYIDDELVSLYRDL